MKKNINITVDVDAYQTAIDMGINISHTCNEALREAVMMSDTSDANNIREEAKSMMDKADQVEEKRKSREVEIENNLYEFDNLDRRILDNDKALMYWTKKTRVPIPQLIERKKEQFGVN